MWLLILLEAVRTRLPRKVTWKAFSRLVLSEAHFDTMSSFVGFFLCLMALFMTNSRAGTLASLLGMIAAGVIYLRADLPKRSNLIVAIVISLGLAYLVLQILGGNVNQRFETSGFADEGRLSTYQATLRIIADHPWFGTGLGTFIWAFPAYRPSTSLQTVWDMAHSTPLEMAAELGIPLTVLVGLGLVTAFFVLIRGVRTRRRDVIIPLCALTTSSVAILHSCVDFSLQITGFAVVIMALLGVGLAQSFRSGTEKKNSAGDSSASARAVSIAGQPC